jgi:DNA-binding protein YbaB
MPDEPAAGAARLPAQAYGLFRDACAAADVRSEPGRDASESVTVSLDMQGRVVAVGVVAAWRHRLGNGELSEAVTEAVRDAAMRRMEAWAETYGGASVRTSDEHPQDLNGPYSDRTMLDPEDFHRRLQAVTTDQHLSDADRQTALTELLALAQAIERGIDEVSSRLQATLSATHTGRSPDGHVTVTLTGGGEMSTVRLDRAWLRDAHEINIGRQITAAFRAAYEAVAASGVQRLIADSPLGAAQRATQDPFGLARRLRITD